jgi:ABC-type antimicrobial peptide transport system permease subunit
VLGRGLFLTLAGIGFGLAIAVVAGRALRSLLYGVGSSDPVTMAAVVASTGAVALVACYVPGRSATRVDPMVALRTE